MKPHPLRLPRTAVCFLSDTNNAYSPVSQPTLHTLPTGDSTLLAEVEPQGQEAGLPDGAVVE